MTSCRINKNYGNCISDFLPGTSNHRIQLIKIFLVCSNLTRVVVRMLFGTMFPKNSIGFFEIFRTFIENNYRNHFVQTESFKVIDLLANLPSEGRGHLQGNLIVLTILTGKCFSENNEKGKTFIKESQFTLRLLRHKIWT